MKQARTAGRAGPAAAGEAARPAGPQARAHSVHRRLPDHQARRYRRQGHPWLPRREEDNGRGRRLAVDPEGWLLALVVTAASVSDKAAAKLLAIKLFDAFPTLRLMWADSGYDGAPLARWIKTIAAITIEVVKRTSDALLAGGQRQVALPQAIAGSTSGCSVALTSTQVTSRATPRASIRPWWKVLVRRYQAASGPVTDRRYNRSPTRTIQTVRARDSEPSRRTELTSTSPAPPSRSRSSFDQLVTGSPGP
jgi:Transposase DDE domain